VGWSINSGNKYKLVVGLNLVIGLNMEE